MKSKKNEEDRLWRAVIEFEFRAADQADAEEHVMTILEGGLGTTSATRQIITIHTARPRGDQRKRRRSQ